MNKKEKLTIPQGTESLHLGEAFTHRAFIRDLENSFQNWGYLPVETPVIDFFEDYQNLISSDRLDETYRLIDREGELLMLRSDITLFLARQLSINLNTESLPVRAYYADTILRYQDKEDISHNEFFQTGCELIGKNNLDGDLEVLMLAREQLLLLGLNNFRMHIGSRSLFNNLTSQMAPSSLNLLINDLNERYRQGVLNQLIKNYKPDEAESILSILFFIGTLKDFSDFVQTIPEKITQRISKDLAYLNEMIQELRRLDKEQFIRIDFSEIGNQDYYSGIVFQCYAPGADSAILSGGRYDHLITCQGDPVSSFGFSLYQRKLENLLPSRKIPSSITLEEKGSFAQRFEQAERLRKQNKRVIL